MDPASRGSCEELLAHSYFDTFREEMQDQQPPPVPHHHKHRRRNRRSQAVTSHKSFVHLPVSDVTNIDSTMTLQKLKENLSQACWCWVVFIQIQPDRVTF